MCEILNLPLARGYLHIKFTEISSVCFFDLFGLAKFLLLNFFKRLNDSELYF